MTRKARVTIAVLSSLIAYVSINSLIRAINPNAFVWSAEDNEESRWIATSHSWFDRKACRFFGLCGASHFRLIGPTFGRRVLKTQQRQPVDIDPDDQENDGQPPWQSFWTSAADSWDESNATERSFRDIPNYVFEYAPYVYLSAHEQFWPGDIAEHLYHTTPRLNYTPIQSQSSHPNLRNLHHFNQYEKGWNVFLASDDNVEERPSWIEGESNIPEPGGEFGQEPWADWDGRVDGDLPYDTELNEWAEPDIMRPQGSDADNQEEEDLALEADRIFQQDLRKRQFAEQREQREQRVLGGSPSNSGRSNAPAVLVVIDKGNDVIDAFWFYFYSFNRGNSVFNVRFGNHIGDWEHCLVRFYHGKPRALFFSAHSAGEAYSYEAVEKLGKRVSQIPKCLTPNAPYT